VGPAGTVTSTGEVTPTLATVASLLESMMGINSKTGLSETTKANFPTNYLCKTFKAGIPLVPH
jgi:hypothetical protein